LFFLLSKTLDALVDPFWWVFAPALAGVVLLARGKRRGLGLGLALGGLTVLFVAGLPWVGDHLRLGLEQEAVDTSRPDVTYDAVVLLGGAVSPEGASADQANWNDSVERLMVTRDLLASGRARAAIVSGGSYGIPGLPTEAEYLKRQLVAWGIAEDRVVLEDRALNTRENAVFSGALARARGFQRLLVVTSAFHVPRAQGCFRAAGVEADFLPVDYRMRDPGRNPHWLPRASVLGDTAAVVRERFGFLVYRVMGYAR
jgi:uncharacterized SAM-binding protein YcdF (DUF218 family)